MNMEALVHQLLSVRAAIDAALSIIQEDECHHPPESRRVMTVMGGPERWVCEVCGYEYEEDA